MSEEAAKTRTQHHEIEIDAPIEAVWKALTDAEEITRWFSDEAKVVPGPAGTIGVAFGKGESRMDGAKRIEVWEPGKRLILSSMATGTQAALMASLDAPIVEEYTLESRGGKTVLKLVHSNIPDSPDWNAYFDGTNYGWRAFFLGLRHYLQNAAGKKRDVILFMRPLAIGFSDAWKALTGTDGLAASGAIDGLPPGSRYSAVTALGDRIEGEVVESIPPKILMLTIEGLGDALLSAAFEEMSGMSFAYLTVAMFGMERAKVDEIRGRWLEWLGRLLPAPTAQLSPDVKPIC